ncbi:MAG TPA: endolytic transglycosylase MltG [Vicinamibacterales bacterium]|nr:endolytic transglycosylase MltG [Vicinamibacterales bacterium]
MKRLVVLVLALVVLATGVSAWWIQTRLGAPFGAHPADGVFVDVPAGAGPIAIGSRLVAAGVVPDVWTFRLAARLEGVDRRLQAGEYHFTAPASPRDVVQRIAAGDVYTRPVTFPEGLTVAQLADVFAEAGLGQRADFLAAAGNASFVAHLDPDARDLEGYLFPDTYPLRRHVTAREVVSAMVGGFERAFDATLREAARAQALTVREVVTLASLIEKETARAEELTQVSAVFRNRLRIGMPMQCDPTVIYALMRAGRWNGNIRRADLQIDDPYNTYRYRGLPPGPIAAPGRGALAAALAPADVTYLYFVSRNDGTHVFASTLAEHNRNVARWQVRYFRNR